MSLAKTSPYHVDGHIIKSCKECGSNDTRCHRGHAIFVLECLNFNCRKVTRVPYSDLYAGCCANPEVNWVRYKISNGVMILRRFCSTCNYLDPVTHKKSSVSNFDQLKVVTKTDCRDRYLWFPEDSDLYNKVSNRVYNERRTHTLDEFRRQHNEYLRTEKWRKKREYVLKRDNRTCQACGYRKATDVHHLHYNTWQDEPLFDLVSVCRTCHDKIHDSQRKEWLESIRAQFRFLT